MEIPSQVTNFSQAQIEVLNAVAHLRTEDEIRNLRLAISHFFFERANEEMDRLWETGAWTKQTLQELKQAHYRTPYKSQR
jgi:hypothetical protein